jgi:hypothetical protein
LYLLRVALLAISYLLSSPYYLVCGRQRSTLQETSVPSGSEDSVEDEAERERDRAARARQERNANPEMNEEERQVMQAERLKRALKSLTERQFRKLLGMRFFRPKKDTK